MARGSTLFEPADFEAARAARALPVWVDWTYFCMWADDFAYATRATVHGDYRAVVVPRGMSHAALVAEFAVDHAYLGGGPPT